MDKDKVKHLNRKVAISVAFISTFMAISKVKDDNIVQAMQKAKSDSVDSWNEYQAKRIKHHLADASLLQSELLVAVVPAPTAAKLRTNMDELHKQVERYGAEETQLMKKAKELEAAYDAYNFKDDQFDLSDAALSVGLMLLAVTALTAEVWLLFVSWGFSFLGALFGIAGFAGWSLHPDWLIRLLS